MTRKTSGRFTDPLVRQKAIDARLANPKGKRGGHAFEDIEDDLPLGVFPENAAVNTLGRRIGRESKEKLIQRERARVRLEEVVDTVFDTAAEILKGPPDDLSDPSQVTAWAKVASARAIIVNKFLDKLVPDLRTDIKGGAQKVTHIMIGGPLQGAMRNALTNGNAIAAQYTEIPAEASTDE